MMDLCRVKITHSKMNKDNGFYLLMINGNTFSNKKDVFIVERKQLNMLKNNNVKYKELI